MSWPIIFLLVIGLLVQNTCPHGFGGKTALAKECGHCPFHLSTASSGSQKVFKADHADSSDVHNPANFPMYVFAVPKTIPCCQPHQLRTAHPALIDGYQDPLPDELLKPPRA
jgi:hypothetical protein